MSLKNKVVWITASAGGIGKAMAKKFAAEGAKLILCDLNEEELRKTEEEIKDLGADVLAVQYDGGNAADIENVFNKAMERFGTIDALINNAGIAGPTKSIIDTSVEEFDKTLEVNLRGTFLTMHLAAPVMIKNGGGKIVNMASHAGKNALVNRCPYTSSKMGVIALTRVAAKELGQYNITVNSICPGAVAGPRLEMVFQRDAEAKGMSVQEVKDAYYSTSPIKHAVPPEDIAELAAFLCDEEKSGCITGEDVNITCGTVMY